jgi:AraC-like DNA-binding protein
MSVMSGASALHDRSTGGADRAPTGAATGPDGDLSTALSRLRLEGAIFLRGEYTEAWAYESLPARDATMILAPQADRVILFHVVAKGRAWIETTPGERLWAEAGDVIVLPYGDAHRMGGELDAELIPIANILDPPPWSEMPVIRSGAGGTQTDIVCGYLTCEDPLFDPRLRALPSVFVVSPPDGAAREWVRASIAYAAQQTSLVSDREVAAPTQVPELLLMEVLKLHLATAPASQTGWLRALRDPVLAPALAAVHGAPEHKWNLVTLARKANVSVSLLDERFREVLGLAPIRYLTGWRMHVARDLLRSADLGVGAVARRVGYPSR